MPQIPFYLVDAFTDKKFAGNPAGVCLLEEALSANMMQNIAAEVNQAETAFVSRESESYHIRWFTPTTEVDLCGHATLASAYVLKAVKQVAHGKICFQSKSGELGVQFEEEAIQLDFPVLPFREKSIPPELIELLNIELLNAGWAADRYLIEVGSKEELLSVKPDFQALARFAPVIITCKSMEENYDFYSRFFVPSKGINEDPVTGSAHCALAPYWAAKLDKTSLNAYQLSARGGGMQVTLSGERVLLTGKARMIIQGQLLL